MLSIESCLNYNFLKLLKYGYPTIESKMQFNPLPNYIINIYILVTKPWLKILT